MAVDGVEVDTAGAADAARERSGGRFPPPFVPIDGALDRARATLGDSADELWHEGRSIPLFAAMSMAREAIRRSADQSPN